MIDAPCESNIKINVEEHVSSENVHSAGDVREAIYHQCANQSQEAVKRTEVIQKVVLPEVSQLYHPPMNKTRENKYHFLQKKDSRKRKIDSSLCQSSYSIS